MTKYTTFIIFLLLSFIAFGQQTVKVSGNLKAYDGEPAMNINVMLKGTTYGGISNANGYFEFQALPGKYTLLISSLSYQNQEIPVTLKTGKKNYFEEIKLQESTLQLDEVVVTGTRTEKRLSKAPVQTTVISYREMKKSGSTSVTESLQDNIPGLTISPNAMGNNMRIRGLNTRYILILVDGERLIPEGAGGNINLDQVDVNNIERIEMVNGAASALYGSNAVGAVINIITKKTKRQFEGGANVVAESYNTWTTKVNAGFKHNKLSSRISAFRKSSDGFGGEDGIPYAASYRDYGSNLKFGINPTKNIDINLSGRFFQHETFHEEGTLEVAHPLTHSLSAGVNGGYTTNNKRYKLRLSSNFDKFFDYLVLEKLNNKLKKKNSANYLSNRLTNTYTLNEKWEFVGGLEHNHETRFAEKTLGAEPTTKTINDANVFAQADYKPIEKLNIISGLRYTYNSQFKSAFTPKLSAMYQFKNIKFRAGSGFAFRAPSIKELYYDFDHQGMFWIYGNPNLKAEKGLYNSLSAEYTDATINASISGYHNKISNKITQYKVNNIHQTELHYTNVSSATLQGIDVNFSILLLKEIVLRANYSFCDARNDNTKLEIPGNIRNSYTFSATWNKPINQQPFSVQLSGRINSPQIYQSIEVDNEGNETVITEKSKTTAIWKLTFVGLVHVKKQTVEVTAKVHNLFNTKDQLSVNPGRQFLLGIRYAFN